MMAPAQTPPRRRGPVLPLLLLLLAATATGPLLLAHALQPDGGSGKPPLAPSPSPPGSSNNNKKRPGTRLLGSGEGRDRDAMVDLGRLFREQEEKEIARLKAQEQVCTEGGRERV